MTDDDSEDLQSLRERWQTLARQEPPAPASTIRVPDPIPGIGGDTPVAIRPLHVLPPAAERAARLRRIRQARRLAARVGRAPRTASAPIGPIRKRLYFLITLGLVIFAALQTGFVDSASLFRIVVVLGLAGFFVWRYELVTLAQQLARLRLRSATNDEVGSRSGREAEDEPLLPP